MRVDNYFGQLNDLVAACPLIQLSRITFDHRGTHVGFVRGELVFLDDSTLHLREYVDVESSIDRLMYVYQYMNPDGSLVFRYDHMGHHRELNLDSYPHHKHEGREENIIASSAPTLGDVLAEIQGIITFP